ncbi:MAG: transcriptional regulator GutM [Microbacteriaceae bacterium]
MEWSFAVFFVIALILGGILSYIQHRAYAATVRELAAEHHVAGLGLVSGRGKGFLKGIAIILVVDRQSQQVLDARKMVGASIFARFKEAPELRGTIASLRKEYAEDKKMSKALNECVSQLRAMPAPKLPSSAA